MAKKLPKTMTCAVCGKVFDPSEEFVKVHYLLTDDVFNVNSAIIDGNRKPMCKQHLTEFIKTQLDISWYVVLDSEEAT